MSLSLSTLNRPAARAQAIAPLSRLTSRLMLTITGMQRRRARRQMVWAVLDSGHVEVIADAQRAMRN